MRHLLIIGLIPSLGAFICNAMKKGGDDLRAKVQNPVSSMYSLPLKLTADFGAPNGSAYFFNVNPIIPVTVGDWNLISRSLIPLCSHVHYCPLPLSWRPSNAQTFAPICVTNQFFKHLFLT
jgi:hypothetical protein